MPKKIDMTILVHPLTLAEVREKIAQAITNEHNEGSHQQGFKFIVHNDTVDNALLRISNKIIEALSITEPITETHKEI